MSWHIFVLVWGDEFVDRFARFAVPSLALPGNMPVLAKDDRVFIHAYTDEGSRASVETALAPMANFARIDVRIFDDTAALGRRGPDYKYELQRWCLRDLVRSLDNGTLILLDSNFVLADGAFGILSQRRRAGYSAATVSVLRVMTTLFVANLAPALANGASCAPRQMMRLAWPAMHHITRSFFVDAEPFTPYPSQLSWRIGDEGFVNRNFLPHPLMIPVSAKVALSQSTMDYDLALRLVDDDKIYVCRDSDEILVLKFSDEEHQASRSGTIGPTAQDIGLFLLACTNQRHRLFADASVQFHMGDVDERFANAAADSQVFIDAAYDWIFRTASQPTRLDARLLMYLKSHLGPIEDFMSPQLEPAALARLL